MNKSGLRFLGALLAGACLLVVLPGGASAQCPPQDEAGQWKNVNSDTRSLTRIELTFTCQDQILNGEPYPPGSPWKVHVFGQCRPSDCDWGEVEARRLGTGHVYAFYDQGFAKRHVWARMSQYRPGKLWVYMYTDFVNPNRPDYDVHNWFRPQ